MNACLNVCLRLCARAAAFLGTLCEALDGRSDIFHYPDAEQEPAEWMDETMANPRNLCRDRLRLLRANTDGDVVSVKLALCELIGFFWDCRNDARLTMLIDMYDEIVDNKIGPSLFATVTQATAGKGGDKFLSVAPVQDEEQEAIAVAKELELPIKWVLTPYSSLSSLSVCV
jgi:hypothetical protein